MYERAAIRRIYLKMKRKKKERERDCRVDRFGRNLEKPFNLST